MIKKKRIEVDNQRISLKEEKRNTRDREVEG